MCKFIATLIADFNCIFRAIQAKEKQLFAVLNNRLSYNHIVAPWQENIAKGGAGKSEDLSFFV